MQPDRKSAKDNKNVAVKPMKKASGHQDFLHELIIEYSGNIFDDSSKYIALAGNCIFMSS